MAVPRVVSVNPTRLTDRNEPHGDRLCLDSAFVSDDVHVVASLNKRHPHCVHGPRAGGIVPSPSLVSMATEDPPWSLGTSNGTAHDTRYQLRIRVAQRDTVSGLPVNRPRSCSESRFGRQQAEAGAPMCVVLVVL